MDKSEHGCAGAASDGGRVRRDGGGWARLAAVPHRAYLGAWLYLGNLIIAASFGWVPPRLAVECAALATAAVVVIVLLAPRPMRAVGLGDLRHRPGPVVRAGLSPAAIVPADCS